MSARSPAPLVTARGAGLVAILTAILLFPGSALAARGSGEVRVSGTCGSGATSRLRLEPEDGRIRIRFRVDSRRGHSRWHVVLVREGRVVWRDRVRADGGGSFTVRRSVRNLRGADQVTARALGPRGITCIATATLRG